MYVNNFSGCSSLRHMHAYNNWEIANSKKLVEDQEFSKWETDQAFRQKKKKQFNLEGMLQTNTFS